MRMDYEDEMTPDELADMDEALDECDYFFGLVDTEFRGGAFDDRDYATEAALFAWVMEVM